MRKRKLFEASSYNKNKPTTECTEVIPEIETSGIFKKMILIYSYIKLFLFTLVSIQDDAAWLKLNVNSPYGQIEQKWKNTFHHRRESILKSQGVSEALQMWPLFRSPYGYNLVSNPIEF